MADPVVKVTNVSPLVTEKHLREMFGYVGTIDQMRLTHNPHLPENVQECVIQFASVREASTALHLNGTDLVDRPISVVHFPHPLQVHAEELAAASTTRTTASASDAVKKTADDAVKTADNADPASVLAAMPKPGWQLPDLSVRAIVIDPVPTTMLNDREMREMFGRFGVLTKIKLVPRPDSQPTTNDTTNDTSATNNTEETHDDEALTIANASKFAAVLEFTTPQAAAHASLKYNNSIIDGCRVAVSLLKDAPSFVTGGLAALTSKKSRPRSRSRSKSRSSRHRRRSRSRSRDRRRRNRSRSRDRHRRDRRSRSRDRRRSRSRDKRSRRR